MPITHQWDEYSDGLYLVKAEGADWEWPDFTATIRAIYHDLAAFGQPVNFALWFNGKLPRGNILAQMRVVGGDQPANIRHTVFINNSGKFLEMLITSFDRANGWEGPGFVASLDEARTYLAEKVRLDHS